MWKSVCAALVSCAFGAEVSIQHKPESVDFNIENAPADAALEALRISVGLEPQFSFDMNGEYGILRIIIYPFIKFSKSSIPSTKPRQLLR
jgi:hypothetical protein